MAQKLNVFIFMLLVFAIIVGGFMVFTILQNDKVILEHQKDLNAKLQAMELRLSSVETGISGVNKSFSDLTKMFKQQPEEPQEDLSKVYDLPVDGSYVVGPQDAPITVTVFSDFQCPYCSKFHQPLKEALAAYPDKVKFVMKHFPLSFHQNAKPAAKAALAAGEQGKYKEMMDALFENNTQLSPEKYVELAQKLGLDVEKFKKDLAEKDAAYEAQINKDMELGMKSGVRGTPTFFINGKLTRARDVASFKQEFDAILNKDKQGANPEQQPAPTEAK